MGKRGNKSRNRGARKQNRSRGPQTKKRKPFDPEKHFLPENPPEREYDPCELSGEQIEDIVTAIAHPRTGKPVRFDRVLESLLEQENEQLAEDERIAYLGKGTFGIIRIEKKAGGRPELTVRKYFHYEDTHEKHEWRRELAPGISKDYIPNPQPLSDLYTSEEIAQFPRFDAAGSLAVTRGS